MNDFNTICLARHSLLPNAAELAARISERYAGRCEWWHADESTLAADDAFDRMSETDLVVTIGGDGSILRAVHAASPHDIPVLGINMGRVGFMSEIDSDDALDDINWYLEGNGVVDDRTMLDAALAGENEGKLWALNDVTVHRGGELRVIEVTAIIDGIELSTYRGDGVIVATATGSTGYTLQLGGPVIDPTSSVFLLKPIAAHMSQFGGVILDSPSVLELKLETPNPATLTVDGFISHEMDHHSLVKISRSERKAKFLRRGPRSSFWNGLSHRLGMRIGAVQRDEGLSE